MDITPFLYIITISLLYDYIIIMIIIVLDITALLLRHILPLLFH